MFDVEVREKAQSINSLLKGLDRGALISCPPKHVILSEILYLVETWRILLLKCDLGPQEGLMIAVRTTRRTVYENAS